MLDDRSTGGAGRSAPAAARKAPCTGGPARSPPTATLGAMSPTDFVLETEMRVSPLRLHDFLCDLHNYVPLHPLIESIEEIPARADDAPKLRRYRVIDRIPLGPIRLRTVYEASLESVSALEVHGHATQSPGIRLHTVYALSEVATGTRLVERVSVEAPLLLRRFVITKARRSHEETLAKMKALLERGGDDRSS